MPRVNEVNIRLHKFSKSEERSRQVEITIKQINKKTEVNEMQNNKHKNKI